MPAAANNGLRLLLPARKSRKGDDDAPEDERYARQEHKGVERAERDGHVVVKIVRDTVSSQTLPWERKNLKKWMTDPELLAQYDGFIAEADRLARLDDKGWHDIEAWCYAHDKKIITTDGVQFPARDDSDRYQWVGLKRRARTYWEDVRDKHAGTREVIKANGSAIGKPGFGYVIVGEKLHKQFVPDDVNSHLVKEAFQRIADGKTGSQVAAWLTEKTGSPWRIKRLLDMIRRASYYTGERDGHVFEPLVSEELWTAANNALAGRSFERKGRSVEHGYSSLIYCPCGAVLYRHKAGRGAEKYRCARGRRGNVTEAKCEYGAHLFDVVNEAVDTLMSRCMVPERIVTTTGGDHARQAELKALQQAMEGAMRDKDMAEVTRLAASFQEASERPAEPIRTVLKATGKSYGQLWSEGSLGDRRALLERHDFTLTVWSDAVTLKWAGDSSARWINLHDEAGLLHWSAAMDTARF